MVGLFHDHGIEVLGPRAPTAGVNRPARVGAWIVAYNIGMSTEGYDNACSVGSDGLGTSRDGLSDADLGAIYERYRQEILRYAVRCSGRREVAEDLTNEAFLRMVQNRETIDPDRVAAWLTTIVKHLAADYWRHQMLERKHSLSLVQQEPASSIDWRELLRSTALKAEHRACLILHYEHGMERKEIVSHTGLTENQVKSCLQYGMTLLRKAMR